MKKEKNLLMLFLLLMVFSSKLNADTTTNVDAKAGATAKVDTKDEATKNIDTKVNASNKIETKVGNTKREKLINVFFIINGIFIKIKCRYY